MTTIYTAACTQPLQPLERPEKAAILPSSSTARRRAVAVIAVLLACFGLSACDVPPPSITWYGNETAVDVGPQLYCTLTDEDQPSCSETDGPTARLKLYADDPVQVNLPADIAERPWLLVYRYADDVASYRTPVFNDPNLLSYTIRPLAGKQLEQVDLQVLIITADPSRTPQYTPLQAWVLAVDPA